MMEKQGNTGAGGSTCWWRGPRWMVNCRTPWRNGWLKTSRQTTSYLIFWVPKYAMMRGTKNLTDIEIMSPQMKKVGKEPNYEPWLLRLLNMILANEDDEASDSGADVPHQDDASDDDLKATIYESQHRLAKAAPPTVRLYACGARGTGCHTLAFVIGCLPHLPDASTDPPLQRDAGCRHMPPLTSLPTLHHARPQQLQNTIC